ncbi:MAG: leucine-rich repeat domain-containing protein, partial [Eubacterium sp.]
HDSIGDFREAERRIITMMNQRKRSILFLLFTAGLFAGVLFCTETTQAKVKTTIKNGVCTVSGKGAMTDDTSYNKKIKKVIIKDGVTSLPEEAFAGCLKLKEISIADSVKSIGACAFMQTDLREITIPNSVKKLGNSVLSSCKKLTKVKMPGNVKIIYGSDEYFPVFQFDVDSPVKTIELTSSLNLEIFMYLSAENIVVSKNDPKYTSIDGLLYTKDGKSLVRIPNLRKKAVIADGCEEFCTTAVEWAGDDDGDPYMGCEDLKTIVLPESIRTINTKKHLTRWGTSSYAEEHHTDKTDYISFTIANKNMPWEQVSLLHKKFNTPYETLQKEVPAVFGPGAEQGFITPKDGTVLLKYVGKDDNVCIPQGITKIEKNAFASSTLKNVVFPEGLEKIGENAFANCKKLTKVTIPKSVDIIDQDAFSKCKNLKKITFKGTPSDISPYAFDGTAVVSEPGSIKTQYTWAVLDRLKSTRKKSVFNGTFHCLRLKSADGYELQISSTKKFTKKTTKTFAVKKDGKRVCRNLKLPNDLYLRIRPYKLTGSEKTYGKWTYADYDTWGYADET